MLLHSATSGLSKSILPFSAIRFIISHSVELEIKPRLAPSAFGTAYAFIQHVRTSHAKPNIECITNMLVHIQSSATTSLLKRIIELLHQIDITDPTAPTFHACELKPALISP